MIAGGVKTQEEIENELRKRGFTPIDTMSDGGRFWKSSTGRHLHVPDSYEGMYPDFILGDLLRRADYLNGKKSH
ncbi:hypothetical protein J7E70_02385 [Variovorax paradoxus]|nr:hypothetical protein [Variovorax paradoxus]MBT2299301.1 hypothetical protein [Variovorax paradoxus]